MNIRYASLLVLGLSINEGLMAQESMTRISVETDRALAHAGQRLGTQLGVAITFEEMPFEFAADLQEYESPSSATTFIPRYGKFDFEYAASDDPSVIVHSLVESYHEQYPGIYKVVEEAVGEDGKVFHIVPDRSKDKSGNFVSRPSILDVPVSVDGSNLNARHAVCDVVIGKVAENLGAPIVCLTEYVPSLWDTTIEKFSSQSESARTQLVKLGEAAGIELSWYLFRSSKGDYGITFYQVGSGGTTSTL